MATSLIGLSIPRIDGGEKLTGRAQFADDPRIRGAVHARLFLSPYAHARIRRLSTRGAKSVPGVIAVLTADDLPFGEEAPAVRGRCLLARGEVRFSGEPVAVVVAQSEFEPLPALVDPRAAADPSAPLVQPALAGRSTEGTLHAALKVQEEKDGPPTNVVTSVRFTRGDVDRGLRAADVVLSRTFSTSIVHQAYIEPHAVTADYDPGTRRLTIWTATQGLFYTREHVAAVLGLPEAS